MKPAGATGVRVNPLLARQALSRRLSALLCAGLLLGLATGLAHWTHGFEIWTFEGRRQAQWQAGELRAAPAALRGLDGKAPDLWASADAAPAAYLVDFIYTRCPSICRTLGSQYQQMQRQLAGSRTVRLVSVSFDLEHDDPAQLAHYASSLQVDPQTWTLAVPATPGDADRLLRSLGVVVVPDGQGGFVHNGAIHLLDHQGRLRGLFEFDEWPQALQAARRLAAPSSKEEPR